MQNISQKSGTSARDFCFPYPIEKTWVKFVRIWRANVPTFARTAYVSTPYDLDVRSNCGATRKRSRPVDGRRPQTFDLPGRLLGSAAQDLLAQPASFGDRACCLQTTAPSETARPIAAGCRSVGGMARLFGSRSASSIPNSGQQGQIEPDLQRSEPGDFGQQSGRRSLRQLKPLCLGVGELRPRQPIRRATSSRLSPAARCRTRAPASRSAIKRTIGSGCAASIAAASVIGSLIGHSARGDQQQQPKNFASDYPGRAPCAPVLLRASEGPKGAGVVPGLLAA